MSNAATLAGKGREVGHDSHVHLRVHPDGVIDIGGAAVSRIDGHLRLPSVRNHAGCGAQFRYANLLCRRRRSCRCDSPRAQAPEAFDVRESAECPV